MQKSSIFLLQFLLDGLLSSPLLEDLLGLTQNERL